MFLLVLGKYFGFRPKYDIGKKKIMLRFPNDFEEVISVQWWLNPLSISGNSLEQNAHKYSPQSLKLLCCVSVFTKCVQSLAPQVEQMI